jgi:RNA polymerase sigma-70 factor (ECF subfamily)
VDQDLAPLVARLRCRDGSAFDEVYARFHERIFRFLLRLSGKRHVAEDLFQETWVAVARDAHTLVEGSDLAAWLFAVARNRYRSHRRWALLDVTRIFSFASESDDTAPSPEGEVFARAEALALRQAFAALAPASKEVLLLSIGEGFSAPEVALSLGITAEAARQRLSRARAELAAAIEKGNNQGARRKGGAQ